MFGEEPESTYPLDQTQAQIRRNFLERGDYNYNRQSHMIDKEIWEYILHLEDRIAKLEKWKNG